MAIPGIDLVAGAFQPGRICLLLRERIEREKVVLSLMTRLYCAQIHPEVDGLCPDCAGLISSTHRRLEACPHGDRKPSCPRCDVYCFTPRERARIQDVMRHGARLFFPVRCVLALMKVLDRIRAGGPGAHPTAL